MTALVAPFLLAAAGLDFVEVRNLIGALVPLLVAAAIGLGCRRAGSLGLIGSGIAVSLFLAVLGGVSVSGQMQRPDWRGAAAALGRPTTGRILVVARNGNAPIAYYRGALEFRPPRLPAVRVKEIDVISTLGTISPPGNGFRLTQRRGMTPWFHAVAIPSPTRDPGAPGRGRRRSAGACEPLVRARPRQPVGSLTNPRRAP
jgi:hypothetical protein